MKYLLAASTGGHLAQLHRIMRGLEVDDDSLWITFDTPQSRSLLRGRRVLYVPYIAPRDAIGVLRARRIIDPVLRDEVFAEALSTGAALALAALPAARRRGIPARYIESVSRTDGPSLTGRILELYRSILLETQSPAWAHGRWRMGASVFDGFYARDDGAEVAEPRIFVTLGTIRGYRFDALIDAVLATGLSDERTVWQLGDGYRQGLPGTTHRELPSDAFAAAIANADVVITHAGVGTLLGLFDAGQFPVVVPRSRARWEHVDDHQRQIARLLVDRQLALVAEPAELDARMLRSATLRHVMPRSSERS